jgi:hypothetical protein
MAAMMFAATDATPASGGTLPPKTVAGVTSIAPEKTKGAEVVCTEETPAGTHFTHRVCSTRDERELRTRQDQEMLDRVRGRNGGPGGMNHGEGAGTGSSGH